MITQSSLPDVVDFYHSFQLNIIPNLKILLDSKLESPNIFGDYIVPSYYIYGSDHRLIKKQVGSMKVKALVESIK